MQSAFAFNIFNLVMFSNCFVNSQSQEFLFHPSNITTFQLHGVYFVCKVSGYTGLIQWRLPSGRLIDRSLVSTKWYVSETQQDNSIYTRLYIHYSEGSDIGRYECVWSPVASPSISSTPAYLYVILPGTGDVHLCAASLTELNENELITVTCAKVIEGHDYWNENEKTLHWEWTDNILDTSNNFIRVDNWNSRLWYDVGFSFYARPEHDKLQLTCTAVFSDNLAHDCTVGPINVLYVPIVTATVMPRTIRDGDEVILACDAKANPTVHSYTWYANGEVVVDENQGYIIKDRRLYIPNADIAEHDSLLVTCVAANTQGIGQSSVRLHVANSLQYVGPIVSLFLACIVLIAVIWLYLKTRNKKSLRLFLKEDCVQTSPEWQNEYVVKTAKNGHANRPNRARTQRYLRRTHSRYSPSIIVHTRYNQRRDSDEAKSTSLTSDRDTTGSLTSSDSKDERPSTADASTSGIYTGEKKQAISPFLSYSSSVSLSISPESNDGELVNSFDVSYEDLLFEGTVFEDTTSSKEYLTVSPENGRNDLLPKSILTNRDSKMYNVDVKDCTPRNIPVEIQRIRLSQTKTIPLAKWTVTDILFEELDEKAHSEERSASTELSRNRDSKNKKHRQLPSSTRALWHNAGFVPFHSEIRKIRREGVYIKKHHRPINKQLNVNSITRQMPSDFLDKGACVTDLPINLIDEVTRL